MCLLLICAISLLGSGFSKADLVTWVDSDHKGDYWHGFYIDPFKVQVDTTADKCKAYDVTWGAWAIGFNQVLEHYTVAYGIDDEGGNGWSKVDDFDEGPFSANHLMDIDPDSDNAPAFGYCFFRNWFWGNWWVHNIDLYCDASEVP